MKLFEKCKIGNMEVKNRIVMTPMAVDADPDGGFSEENVAYYAERAKGGVGLIITGYSAESDTYEITTCTKLDNFGKIGRASEVVKACHAYGAKVCMQLGPGLGRIYFNDVNTPPYSASGDVASYWNKDLMCKPLSKEDIQTIVYEVGREALIAKRSGADAVELRAYGGYLVDQFMTSLWNHRTDEYGGSLENRLRFIMELVDSIQENCGKDYPLIVKYNPYHAIEGGRQIEEGQEIARRLEQKGVHALHVDKGCYEVWYNAITTVYQKDGHQLDMAAAIKQAVNIPVIAQGKLNDPSVAEQALRDNKTDFIGLGHSLLADAHWGNKVKTGQVKDIIPCIGCNECLRHHFSNLHITCTVNPQLHKENMNMLDPIKEPKKVLVVGGGPGGMQAALTASSRGHLVSLWEKNDRLGGLLWAAGGPDFKYSVRDYTEYMIRQVDKANINVRLMTEADVDGILKGGFDYVIIATGSESFIPSLKGINGKYVYTSTDVLMDRASVEGNRVAVIGGGLVGCETAIHLAQKGKEVMVIEMLDDILATAEHCVNNDLSLRHLLEANKIAIHTNTKLAEVQDGQIMIETGGKSVEIPCDAVVIASGYVSSNQLVVDLDGLVEYTVIGDNLKPRKIFNAVHEGFDIGRTV